MDIFDQLRMSPKSSYSLWNTHTHTHQCIFGYKVPRGNMETWKESKRFCTIVDLSFNSVIILVKSHSSSFERVWCRKLSLETRPQCFPQYVTVTYFPFTSCLLHLIFLGVAYCSMFFESHKIIQKQTKNNRRFSIVLHVVNLLWITGN